MDIDPSFLRRTVELSNLISSKKSIKGRSVNKIIVVILVLHLYHHVDLLDISCSKTYEFRGTVPVYGLPLFYEIDLWC